MEAHAGAWSPNARKIFGRIASLVSAVWNEHAETASLRIAQRMSVTLHRENARAVLKRAVFQSTRDSDNGWHEADDALED